VPAHLDKTKGCTSENPAVSEWMALVSPSQQKSLLPTSAGSDQLLFVAWVEMIKAKMLFSGKCNREDELNERDLQVDFAQLESKYLDSQCHIHEPSQLSLTIFSSKDTTEKRQERYITSDGDAKATNFKCA